MKIYLVYEKRYTDFENGEESEVYINSAYKSRRKAARIAKQMLSNAKEYDLYTYEKDFKKKNPFKTKNWVDLYKEEYNGEYRVGSIVIEETKLVA